MHRSLRYALVATALLTGTACKHHDTSAQSATSASNSPSYQIDVNKPKLCTAVRGNGPLIWAHFGSMANILENEGLVEGQAGGSSASISTFIYESILENPAIWKNCGGAGLGCNSQQVADRAAFLIKTMPYWLGVAKDSKEGLAVGHVLELGKTLKGFDFAKLESNDLITLYTALRGLKTLLTSSTVKSFINPAFLDFISPLKDAGLTTIRFRAREAKDELLHFGNFDANKSNILFRPGVIEFRALSNAFGRIGDFYAGNDPKTALQWPDLMNTCSAPAKGKTPWELESSYCGKRMRDLMDDYLTRPSSAANHHRVDDPIGAKVPTVTSTAVLIGHTELLTEARDRYVHSQEPDLVLPQGSVFFGYSSSQKTLEKLKARMPAFPDARSKLFLSLGTMYWGDMLAVSPAEPGLTNALPFEDGDHNKRTSFGGWSDLSPVMAMKAIDCQKIIYVTREGEDSAFAQGVAALVGLKESVPAIYDVKNKDSSYASALNLADSVYCTKWNDFKGTSFDDIKKMFQQSYQESTHYKDDRSGAPVGCAKVF